MFNSPIIATPYALEFVKNAIVFIQIAEFAAQVVMDWNSLKRS